MYIYCDAPRHARCWKPPLGYRLPRFLSDVVCLFRMLYSRHIRTYIHTYVYTYIHPSILFAYLLTYYMHIMHTYKHNTYMHV